MSEVFELYLKLEMLKIRHF